MDLSFLIPSKVRRLVLEYFCLNPEAKIHVNALARELKIVPQLVYRELINLENWGMLFSYAQGNQRVYYVNKRFACFVALTDLLRAIQQVNNQEQTVYKVYDWEKLSKKLDQTPVDEALKAGLQTKRTMPRAYIEEKMLKKKGLL